MLKNFIKVIGRYLLRNRFFTAINIIGLSIGLACTTLIYMYVRHELQYDALHADKDVIYRVLRQSSINGVPYNIGVTSAPFAGALQQDFGSHIESSVRVLSTDALVQVGEKALNEDRILLADSNFFSFFSYPLVKGDGASVLMHPNSVVLTEELAQKYFGDSDPVGKSLRLDNQYDLVVTGIMKNVKSESHLQFDLVTSLVLIRNESWFNEWWNSMLYTFVKIPEPANVSILHQQFPAFMDKFFGADFQRVGNRINLTLEPLRSIYFNNDTRYENGVVHGNKTYLYIFSCVGVLLLILAGINYMNLATALAANRSKEVGIRKTLGSSRKAVALQFFAESFLLSLISFIVALAIVQLCLPLFHQQFGIALESIFEIAEMWWVGLILISVLTIFSGSYPAILLSGFKPINILKGKSQGGVQLAVLRKSLVVFQFAISIFMIIATLIIGSQLDYLQQKDLGFQGDQVLRIRMSNDVLNRNRKSFKEQIESLPAVQNVSFSSGHPGGFFDATTVRIEGLEQGERMRRLWTDEEFLSTLNLSLAQGRWFSHDFPADSSSSVLLNETAITELGWKLEDAIGKRVMLAQFDSTFRTVVGVVKDFHFLPLHQKIEPLIISYRNRGTLLVKVSGSELSQTISSIQSAWDGYGSGFPMEWAFLNDLMNAHYRNETVQAKVFSLFSALSLIIGALGIFGLTSYLASQRKKEISIRKVLGASTSQLSFMLIKDLLLLVTIAAIISMPLVYWSVQRWLQNFAYRTTPGLQWFLLGGGIVLLFALLVAGSRASSAASENPAENLRND